jgi:signal transduction histidine kinase
VHDVGELPAVRGSEWWLEQVFHTLLHNAAEATRVGAPGENTLEVRAWAEPGEVVVEVHDTGTLIPAEDLERLFEPSFSSKTVRWSLAVSHGLVSAMMGELTVKSTAGKGTCFRVRLPAA